MRLHGCSVRRVEAYGAPQQQRRTLVLRSASEDAVVDSGFTPLPDVESPLGCGSTGVLRAPCSTRCFGTRHAVKPGATRVALAPGTVRPRDGVGSSGDAADRRIVPLRWSAYSRDASAALTFCDGSIVLTH